MQQTPLPLEHPYKPDPRRTLGPAPVGTIRHWLDKAGRYRAWIKVDADRWRLHSLVVYERYHGPIPAGCVVHHRDRNSLNDDPDNLVALTRAAHAAEHAYSDAVLKQRGSSLWLAL